MRSPIIAFSLFAAVSPTIVAAAPHSPTLNSEAFTNPKDTEVKIPQRFVVPRSTPPGLNLVADTASHRLSATGFNTNSPASGDMLSVLKPNAAGTSAKAADLQNDAATGSRSPRTGIVPAAVPDRQTKLPTMIDRPLRQTATGRQGRVPGVGNGGSSSSSGSDSSGDTSAGSDGSGSGGIECPDGTTITGDTAGHLVKEEIQ